MLFDDAITEYLTYRQRMGYTPATLRADERGLRMLMAETGNVQVNNLQSRHVEHWMGTLQARGLKPNTINSYVGPLGSFSKWAQDRKLMTRGKNLTSLIRFQKVPEVTRRRVPVTEFPALLDAAACPRDRMLMALGLYLFVRSSEAIGLRLQDVDLAAGEVKVYQPKTKRVDVMPICAELDAELRRWLRWYMEDQKMPLHPDWLLVPARRSGKWESVDGGKVYTHPKVQLLPTRRMVATHKRVQDALRRIGWTVVGEDHEGMHTLRRSGARALFNELCNRPDEARDNALRHVSSMLHHKSVVITETYLGLDVDRERRDVLLKGRSMFTINTDNVTPLRVNER